MERGASHPRQQHAPRKSDSSGAGNVNVFNQTRSVTKLTPRYAATRSMASFSAASAGLAVAFEFIHFQISRETPRRSQRLRLSVEIELHQLPHSRRLAASPNPSCALKFSIDTFPLLS
jgi:hypothetical protein